MLSADGVFYFGKFPDQYADHAGREYLLTFMSMVDRKEARPLLTDYQSITRGFDAKLYGLANEGIENWVGLCSEGLQPRIYASCRFYLYTYRLIAC